MRTRIASLASLTFVLLAACGGESTTSEPVESQAGDQRVAAPGDEVVAEPEGDGRTCGGFVPPGTPGCAENEFCDYPLEAHCGAADQGGVCRPRPEICTREFMPVCGCDGRTYPNRCEANAAGTGVTALEPCAEAAAPAP